MTQFRPSSFQILPIVIKNLLIINGLVFLAQSTVAKMGIINMEALFGLHHVKSPLFEPWQIVTHLFLHGGLLHLVYNMFALWMFGAVLENLWGPKRFLTFYFLCGIGAALIQLVSLWFQYHDLIAQFIQLKAHTTPEGAVSFFQAHGIGDNPRAESVIQTYIENPDNSLARQQIVDLASFNTTEAISQPTIGASGAVFGILAAFVYLFPNTDIYLYFFVPIKAKWIGLLYFGSEIVSAIQNNPTDNIAHWAHIGGGLVGFLLVLTWNRQNRSHFY
jgi:membrane associated rhomboid family serine protease